MTFQLLKKFLHFIYFLVCFNFPGFYFLWKPDLKNQIKQNLFLCIRIDIHKYVCIFYYVFIVMYFLM